MSYTLSSSKVKNLLDEAEVWSANNQVKKVVVSGLENEKYSNALGLTPPFDYNLDSILQFLNDLKAPQAFIDSITIGLTKNSTEYNKCISFLDELGIPLKANESIYFVAALRSISRTKEIISLDESNDLDFLSTLKFISHFEASTASAVKGDNLYNEILPSESETLKQLLNDLDDSLLPLEQYYELSALIEPLSKLKLCRIYAAKALQIKLALKNSLIHLRGVYSFIEKLFKSAKDQIDLLIASAQQFFEEDMLIVISLLNKIKQEIKSLEEKALFEAISFALKHQNDAFAPLLESSNSSRLKARLQNIRPIEQDQFSGLTGILNTTPNLGHIRQAMKDLVGSDNLDDSVIKTLFKECHKIRLEEKSRDTSRTMDVSSGFALA